MKQLLITMSTDLWRSFSSKNFFIAVIGVYIVHFIGVWSEISYAEDILFLFKFFSISSTFNMLVILFCAFPFSTSFYSDWNSQFIKLSVIRSGINRYGFSKFIACAVSSGTAIALGMSLFILSLLLKIPLVSSNSSNFRFFAETTLGGELLINKHYILYFLIHIYLWFLAGALWSVVGLCSSTYILNRFVALFTPFILYYFINLITNSFPMWLRLNVITQGRCIMGGLFGSLLYITLLFCTITFGIGLLFVRNTERRLANG